MKRWILKDGSKINVRGTVMNDLSRIGGTNPDPTHMMFDILEA